MANKYLVVGGVAGGASVAAKLIALIPVWSGSWTDLRAIMPGAFSSINRLSDASIDRFCFSGLCTL